MNKELKQYLQFALIILGAGSLYPLLYLRQNFETAILHVFKLNLEELGNLYTSLGLVYFITYFPSGWLADYFPPKRLMVFSLSMTGFLGLWYAQCPGKEWLIFIYVGWGLSTGLTFWAALLKATVLLAGASRQGRFFGLLEGGRGLVEAILATLAICLFDYFHGETLAQIKIGFQAVVILYSGFCLGIALLMSLFLSGGQDNTVASTVSSKNLKISLIQIISKPRVWLVAGVIFGTYQIFWATYSFSAFLQVEGRMTLVAAGNVSVAKLWMRPVGSILAGFYGDRFGNGRVCFLAMLFAMGGLIVLAFEGGRLPSTALSFIVMVVGLTIYAARGVCWALLKSCQLPEKLTGLAIGLVSLLAYSPDMFLPQLLGHLAYHYAGFELYRLYFSFVCLMGVLGIICLIQVSRQSASAS
ncbi:MAG: nitrate/nitrite transporter [Oligoflexales bacterium]